MKKMAPKIIPVLLFSAGAFLILSCDVRFPVTDNNVNPVVEKLLIPAECYTGSEDTFIVRAVVKDPQGVKDISEVSYQIFFAESGEEQAQGILRDDGKQGDVIPGDGNYMCLLDSALFHGNSGFYQIIVKAVDKEGNVSVPVSDTLNVVQSQANTPSVILRVNVPEIVTSAQMDSVFLSAKISDEQGIADVCSVFCALYLPLANEPSITYILNNDGISGDTIAGDSLFSLIADLKESTAGPGIYTLRFQAKDRGGLLSWPVVASFDLQIENHPPVLSDISAPDIVSRSQALPFTISVKADDQEGYNDIQRVWFIVKKPDGTSSDDIFEMFDNGEHGDELAGDSVFSLSIIISSQNQTGDYEFTFKARDKSGAESNPVIHTITVTE